MNLIRAKHVLTGHVTPGYNNGVLKQVPGTDHGNGGGGEGFGSVGATVADPFGSCGLVVFHYIEG